MRNEGLAAILNTFSSEPFQTGVARVVGLASDARQPVQELRTALGHALWEGFDRRDMPGFLTPEEGELLRAAIRAHVEALNFIVPPNLDVSEPLSEDGTYRVQIPFGEFPGVPPAASKHTAVFVFSYEELLAAGEARMRVIRDNIQFSLLNNAVIATFTSAREDRTRALLERDNVTGLYSGAAVRQKVGVEIEKNGDRRVVIFIVDGDNMKSLNDLHGHLTTDLFLAESGRRILNGSRPSDIVGRWGTGDEFIHVAFDAGLDEAENIAVRHVTASSGSPITVEHVNGTGPVTERRTVSVGASVGTIKDFDRLVQEADLALNRAKGASFQGWDMVAPAPRASEGGEGRNRAWIYPQESPVVVK